MANKEKISYENYILKNPLYIHNHIQYFENTLANLNQIPQNPYDKARRKYEDYLKYLNDREKDIINKLGGEENLKEFAKQAYSANTNIGEINKILDKVFGMGQDIKSFVRREGANVFLKVTKSGKKLRERETLASIKLIVKETKNMHGREVNVYDYKKSAKKLEKTQKEVLLNILHDIQLAISDEDELLTSLNKLLSKGMIQESKEIETPLIKFINETKNRKTTSSELLLQYIVDKMGTYSYLKGLYSESAEVIFEGRIKEILGEEFGKKRGDTRTRQERGNTLKKADNYFIGGKLFTELNPITVSMKNVRKGDILKIQNSSLYGNGKDTGIYGAFAKEDEDIAKLYLYLMINNSFKGKGIKEIEALNKWMSYVFFSGNFSDKEIEKAVYMVINKGNNEVEFVSIYSILKNLKDGDLKITNTKNSGDNLNKLWRTKIYSLSKKYNQKEKSLKMIYENLHDKEITIDEVKKVANSLLNRDRRVTINHGVINHGIISIRS